MALASYESRSDEAVRLGIAACAAAGIKLDVALCTAILHAERGCRPELAPDPTWQDRLVKAWEGAIWVPAVTTIAPA